MIKLFFDTPWDQAYHLLADGSPPMALRILMLNTIIFVLWLYRRARGVPAMNQTTAIQVQSLLLAANILILLQDQVQELIGQFI